MFGLFHRLPVLRIAESAGKTKRPPAALDVHGFCWRWVVIGGNRFAGYFLPRKWQLQWYDVEQPRFERQLLEFHIQLGDECAQLELQFIERESGE